MAVQARSNIANAPFVLSGKAVAKETQTLLQDAGRATVLAQFTLMARVSASGKWVPFTDETATDGTAIPKGIYMGTDIAAATLVAGDVANAPILVGGSVTVDKNQLVIENSKTLNTVVTVGTTDLTTVEEWLRRTGIFTEDTVAIDGYENA